MFQEPPTERNSQESPAQLAVRLKLPFDDLRLLTRALTHRSYVNEHPDTIEDNERLEFLGDAVLDFLVGAWVYKTYPEMREGDMTRMRSALVRTEGLAELARQLNFGPAMRLGRGELHGGGRDRDALLCATFEAVVGAIYSYKGLDAAQSFVLPLIAPAAERIFAQMHTLDPKSTLQEWSQSCGKGIPQYHIATSEGPDHAKVFQIEVYVAGKRLGRGAGPSKHAAQHAAAQAALEAIQMQNDE